MYISVNDNILKHDSSHALIHADVTPENCKRTTYVTHNLDQHRHSKDIAIEAAWIAHQVYRAKNGCDYVGPASVSRGETYIRTVLVPIEALVKIGWLCDTESLMESYQNMQHDHNVVMADVDKERASKIWSDKLRDLQTKSIEKSKYEDRMQVSCDPDDYYL